MHQSSTVATAGRSDRSTGSRDPDTEALLAAEAFGRALRGTSAFAALAAASRVVGVDEVAIAAGRAYQEAVDAFGVDQVLGTIDEVGEERLTAAADAYLSVPAVAAYRRAETALRAICEEAADAVSAVVGLDFAANCGGGGCCG